MLKYRGQFTIVAMLVIAVAAASWAWWLNYSSTDETMRYFGTANAACIHQASSIQILELSPPTNASHDETSGVVVEIEGRQFRIARAWEAGKSPGMTHLRHALLHDASYDDQISNSPKKKVEWNYCLVFGQNDAVTRVAISVESARLKLLPEGAVLSIEPAIGGIAEVIRASEPR